MHQLISILLLAAIMAVFPMALSAQESSSHEQMLRLSDKGVAAFSNGEYRQAAEFFAEAYAAEPDPWLLKNEAIAWLKAGAHDAAIDAASRFLVQDSLDEADVAEIRQVWANAKLGLASRALENGTLVIAEELIVEVEGSEPDPVVTERLGVLRLELADRKKDEQDALAAASQAARERSDQEAERMARTQNLELQREIETQRATAAKAELERRKQNRRARLAGVALAGAGGVIVVANFVYHLVALGWERQFYDIADNGGDPERFETLRDRLTVARVALPVGYALGAATAGTGAWIILRARRGTDTQRAGLWMGVGWTF